ncbi:MAG: hypothetical protein ABI205_02945 [Gemmatimonadaceae bacterium]
MFTRILIGLTLAGAAACSSSQAPDGSLPPVQPLTISSAFGIAASSAAVRDPSARIRYVLHVTNGSASDERITYGACWAGVRLFSSAARSGSPAFDSATGTAACVVPEYVTTISPGGSADLVGHLDVASVLAAGIPPGHYYVSLVVAPNGSPTQIAAGDVDIQP